MRNVLAVTVSWLVCVAGTVAAAVATGFVASVIIIGMIV
jgi:hypothetical protein